MPLAQYAILLIQSASCPFTPLAPTHGNIHGPINNGPLAHACMPWRLLARYKWLDFKTNKDGNECIPDECPSDDERPVPPPSVRALGF